MGTDVNEKTKALANRLKELRREFHRHPEIAFHEHNTAAKVAAELNGLGLEVQTGFAGTGVSALLKGGEDGKTIGLRADMDALPIEEKNEVAYKSEVNGMMHACGHDAHTAMLLGAARYLTENKIHERLKGNVKFIFQPAEEGVRGARAVIRDGILENPKPDAMLACHVSNDLETGEIGLYESVSSAASDRFRAVVRAKGAHAAKPHKTSDAILAACHFVTQIQSIVSRNLDPTDHAVVSVGIIKGGTAANILPQEVLLKGTVRTFKEEIRALVKKRLADFAAALEQSFALDGVGFEYKDGCPPCINDPGTVALLRSAAEKVVGKEKINFIQPTMGGEDFAYFANTIPSAFFNLGTCNPEKGISGSGHTPFFDIDEDALITGVKVFAEAIEQYLATG